MFTKYFKLKKQSIGIIEQKIVDRIEHVRGAKFNVARVSTSSNYKGTQRLLIDATER